MSQRFTRYKLNVDTTQSVHIDMEQISYKVNVHFPFHFGAGQSIPPRRLRPQSGPISHPLKHQILIGIFVIF